MKLRPFALAVASCLLLSGAALAADETAKPSSTPSATPAASPAAKITAKKICAHKMHKCAGKKAAACKGAK